MVFVLGLYSEVLDLGFPWIIRIFPLKVSELLQIPPEEMIMIGDWPDRDVIGAKEVGMMTVFAKYGDTFNTENSGADYDLEDIYDLVSIVENINKK